MTTIKFEMEPDDVERMRKILKRFLDDTEHRQTGITPELRETASAFLAEVKLPRKRRVVHVD